MSDTRAQIEKLLNKSISHRVILEEYYEREDGVIWCLCETPGEEDFHIFRVEGYSVDQWASYLWRVDAEERFNDIVEDQVETPKTKSVELSTLEKINSSQFGRNGQTLIDETTVTIATMEDEQTGETYQLYIEGEDVRDTLETAKDEAFALVCSPFFKHMTQDSASCEARKAFDYLLSLL